MITLLNKFDDKYIIHEDDVLNIAAHYIKEFNLELFLNDLTFDNNASDMAAYDPKKNIIIMNNNKTWESCYKWADKLSDKYKIDKKYFSYILNFYYLYTFFHEMTHVMQKKNHDMLTHNQKPIYLFLYELCEKLHFDSQAFYDKNHDLFPMEIEANNTGLLQSYNLLSHTKLPRSETKVLHLQYLSSLLSNYEKVNKYRILTPMDKLYNEDSRINMDIINRFIDESNLSRNERLNLGLNITPHEYNHLQREKLKILIKR